MTYDSTALYLNLMQPKKNGNGHAREMRHDRPPIRGAARFVVREQPKPEPEPDIEASYDLAADGVLNSAHWGDADSWDADSSANRWIRWKMVRRSRLEARNNGFLTGMHRTHAAFMVRKGPRLVLLDQDEQEADENDEQNKRIKRDWHRWCKVVKLRRKLFAMALSKCRDGEAIAVARNNLALRHEVKLDVTLIETEQCQTPLLPQGVVGYVDGVRFDPFQNPMYYDILPRHPGAMGLNWPMRPDHIPARYVLHWFQIQRPNQHRGVPEQASTLNLGAVARRWREATVAGAEQQASIPTLFHTALAPFSEDNPSERVADPLNPGDSMEIPRGCGVVAPMGWDVTNPVATQPPANYSEFNKQTNSELARPIGLPYTLAAADASNVSFSGSKIECIPYYMQLDDVEREDCNDTVMDPLFALWWQEYCLFRNSVGDPIDGADPDEPPEHRWDWPRNPIADEHATANTATIRLRSMQATPSQIAHENGFSYEAQLIQAAKDYGVTVDDVRQRTYDANFAPKSGGMLPDSGGSLNQKAGAGYGKQPSPESGEQGDQPAATKSDLKALAAAMSTLMEHASEIHAWLNTREAAT